MKIKNRQQFLMILTAAVVVFYAADQVVIEPLAGWWKARSKTVIELRARVKNGRQLLQREAGLRGHWSQMRTNTLSANSSMAEQQILKAFDNWAQESGADVTGITPQWNSDSDSYQTLNCRVEVSGDLSQLSRFVYDVEKDPLAFKLESVELSARDSSGQQLTLNLQISGLVLAAPAPSKQL
jgi:Tfp pilus assembly protein PilO